MGIYRLLVEVLQAHFDQETEEYQLMFYSLMMSFVATLIIFCPRFREEPCQHEWVLFRPSSLQLPSDLRCWPLGPLQTP